MRLPNFNLGQPGTLQALIAALQRAMEPAIQQLNAVSAGKITAANAAADAPPAGISLTAYAHGDFVRNARPVEMGGAGARYIVTGWLCVEAGAPGQWRECRCLTGN